jgi:hypothetical protein
MMPVGDIAVTPRRSAEQKTIPVAQQLFLLFDQGIRGG